MPYRYLEVCAGCGGLSNGLESAGLVPHVLIEINKDCVKTLRKNFQTEILETDMRMVDYTKYKGLVDIVVGGVPCQSFSIAGKREGLSNNNKGGLFYSFFDCIKSIDPLMFMVENVEGLKNINGGRTLSLIVSRFHKMGYQVDHRILNAINFEVPQKRKRLIIIGTKYSTPFVWPTENKNILTLRDALQNVPPSKGVEYSANKKKVLDMVPAGGCWIDLPDDIQKEYMGNSIKSGGGKRGMAKRLSWELPCLTLTTSPCQKQTERCHPDVTRPLTTREYARIQTFPDTFVFEGSVSSIYKQIGNAVPCRMAHHIGLQIISCLDTIYNNMVACKIFELMMRNINIYNKYYHEPNEKDNRIINNPIINNWIINDICTIISIYHHTKIKPIYENNHLLKKKIDLIGYCVDDLKKIGNSEIVVKMEKLFECIVQNLGNWETNGDTILCDKNRTIFIDFKTRSEKEVFDNLLEIKKQSPDAIVLIGIIDGTDYQTTINDSDTTILKYSGRKLFKLVFGRSDYYDLVVDVLNAIKRTKNNEYKKDLLKLPKKSKDKKVEVKKKVIRVKHNNG
jgi:DNA (cytosine-5)-methyltransferase 1